MLGRVAACARAQSALHARDDVTLRLDDGLSVLSNRPERYDRNVTQSTLRAMKKVEEVRVRRAERFYENRMKGKESEDRKANKRELEQQIHLVRAPGATARQPGEEVAKKAKVKVKVSSKATAEYD